MMLPFIIDSATFYGRRIDLDVQDPFAGTVVCLPVSSLALSNNLFLFTNRHWWKSHKKLKNILGTTLSQATHSWKTLFFFSKKEKKSLAKREGHNQLTMKACACSPEDLISIFLPRLYLNWIYKYSHHYSYRTSWTVFFGMINIHWLH